MASKHYVNNKAFYEAIVEYKALCKQYKEERRNSKPQIPKYIGECLYLIATKYATKPNFVNYMFIEDMISDALENCIAIGVDNFDPDRTKNPFAYFTQIIHFAFIRRILKEKKELYIKYKMMQNLRINGGLNTTQENDELKEVDSSFLDTDYMNNLVVQYEETIKQKKIKSKQKAAEKLALLKDDEVQ